MKKELYDQFIIELEKIEQYVNHIKILKNFHKNLKNINIQVLNDFSSDLKKFDRTKKIFDHKSIIISLYGLLENTISNWSQTHIENISKLFNNFEELPEKIKKNHLEFSINVIDEILKRKHSKYEKLDEKIMIKNLYQITSTPTNFILNKEAFIPSSGNLKHSKIVSLLNDVGIDYEQQIKKFNLNKSISLLTINIDRLVSYRNDIAHGNEISEILDTSQFITHINALKEYLFNIFQIINEKEIEYECKNLYKEISSNKIINVYGKYLLDLYIENEIISVHDSIIVLKNGLYEKTFIQDIHFNNISYKNVVISKEKNICLKIDSDIKKNYRFFILKKKYETLNYSDLIYNKQLNF